MIDAYSTFLIVEDTQHLHFAVMASLLSMTLFAINIFAGNSSALLTCYLV